MEYWIVFTAFSMLRGPIFYDSQARVSLNFFR
jgi:hypothetical protein